MPKLEARFFPWQSGGESYVVVGYVVWDAQGNDKPQVEPAASLRDVHSPRAILATLRYIVRTAGTGYEKLASLRVRFWSFVPAGDAAAQSELLTF